MAETNIESREINLESDDDDTLFSDQEQVSVDHINFEFEQTSKIQGKYRKMTVFNDNHCYQAIKNKHQRKFKYRIDLAYLDPKPLRKRFIDWKWLCASVVFMLLGILLLVNGWISASSVPSMVVLIAISVIALMTLLAFFHQSYDRVYFRSQYGRVRLIELINSNPDKATFRNFLTKFIVQINKSKTAKKVNQNKFLSRELQELRRLKNETAVSEREYESAKVRIFKHEAFKAGQ
ncbi:MAG: hypothetical protein ACI822_001357 [Gammaproteobacteria bacterium]|jgi:hypothetical protein